MTQKNIIFFHAESWDGRMLGAMGHPALHNGTPNIDRIARAGTLFENAYCSYPVCCPSRANMWSGRYTQNCESWNNYKGLETGMWSLLGELHNTYILRTLGSLDYLSGGHTQLARLSAWLGPSGIRRPVFDKDMSQCFSVADNDDMRFHTRDWEMIDQAIDFLKQERKPDKPFFLYVTTNLVHAAFGTNNYWLSKIPEEDVDIPPIDHANHPARQYQQMAKAWRYGFEDSTVRQVRRIYMAMCAEADAMVGALYDAMHESGLSEDTYFVFSSDHGEMAMEHQDWYKMTMYEGSVRVPLVVTGPGIQPGQQLPNLVSLIDLCPTFMDMGGLPARNGLDGESLLPLATGQTRNSRNWVYACFMGCTLNTSAYLLRKDQWKYVVYAGYPPQLFNVADDPQELVDLSGEETVVVSRLDADLRAVVDYERVHRDWIAYCKETFRQWRRQAMKGQGKVEELTVAEWDKMFAVNCTGTFLFTKYVVPLMKAGKYGRIINFSSKSGKTGSALMSHYSAAKAAIMGFTQSLACELADSGITSNCICPGITDSTGVWKNVSAGYIENLQMPREEVVKKFTAKIPLKRLGSIDDVIAVTVFLASKGADYMTGQSINVTGGREMH